MRMKIELNDAWKNIRTGGKDKFQKELLEASRKGIMKEALFLQSKIVKGITDQEPGGKRFAPLSLTTLAVRKFKRFRGSKALIVRGDLRNSITIEKTPAPNDMVEYYVGVNRTAVKGNRQLLDIAKLHEYGSKSPIVIKMTAKMRRFLFAAFRKAGLPRTNTGKSTGFIVVKIPARPFVRPVFEKFGKNSRDRIMLNIRKALKNLIIKSTSTP